MFNRIGWANFQSYPKVHAAILSYENRFVIFIVVIIIVDLFIIPSIEIETVEKGGRSRGRSFFPHQFAWKMDENIKYRVNYLILNK